MHTLILWVDHPNVSVSYSHLLMKIVNNVFSLYGVPTEYLAYDTTSISSYSQMIKQLSLLEEEPFEARHTSKHEKLYEKYFTVTQTHVRGIKVIAKEEEEEKSFGYFTLISNDFKDGIEAT